MMSDYRVPAVLLVLCMTLSMAAAQGPIPASDCIIINPTPTITSCAAVYGTLPTADDLLFNLPYNLPEYKQCVMDRCMCTNDPLMNPSPSYNPTGLYCTATPGFQESGFVTCNTMVFCFEKFWQCTIDVLMARERDPAITLTADETAAAQDIINHGSAPGEFFHDTNIFKSCRQYTCLAAQSRPNCGLMTCEPNYTQCFEFMTPPPLPYNHQLCTEGCRAVLVMMAMTLLLVVLSLVCCGCCPAQYKVMEPLIHAQADGGKKKDKRRRDSDAPDSNFDLSDDEHHGDNFNNGNDNNANNNNHSQSNHA